MYIIHDQVDDKPIYQSDTWCESVQEAGIYFKGFDFKFLGPSRGCLFGKFILLVKWGELLFQEAIKEIKENGLN